MNTIDDNVAKLESALDEGFDKQVRELALKKLVPRPGEHILVIGFETRQSQAEIAQAVGPSGKAFGLDMSQRLQRGCRDTLLLPHEANGLDGIFTSYPLERFDTPPLPTVLEECKRVLRPGGRIVVIGLSGEGEQAMEGDSASLRRMLTTAGFTIQEAEVRRMWTPVEIVSAMKERV